MTEPADKDDDAMLAAEYVLGLLEGEEARIARRRASEDAAFAQAVTEWEVRLADMTDDLPEIAPSTNAKQALLQDLFPEPATQQSRQGFWQNLLLWQIVGVFGLVALATVLATGYLSQLPRPGPLYTAEIASTAGDFRVVALVDKTTDEVVLVRTQGAAPEGRILQVWAHGEGEPATSVGLWPEGETVRLELPPEIAAVEGVLTLGVSEEPPGGSPTGSPSGRVFGTVDIPGVGAPR